MPFHIGHPSYHHHLPFYNEALILVVVEWELQLLASWCGFAWVLAGLAYCSRPFHLGKTPEAFVEAELPPLVVVEGVMGTAEMCTVCSWLVAEDHS